jgi:hypothetical protein
MAPETNSPKEEAVAEEHCETQSMINEGQTLLKPEEVAGST